jgi:regulator of sirC expression with transglutaminase-like and TPR domain
MKPSAPLCCNRAAFELLSRQVPAINSSDALFEGAIAIAMHQMENVDAGVIDKTIQSYADTVRSRVRGPQPQALLAHLHEFLFDELGFTGNGEDYYNTINSYVPAVIQTRRGLPIILSLLYKLVAERVGLRCWGVGLPGHFIVGVDINDTPMLVDPFNGGRVLSTDEAHQRMRETFGPEIEWSDELIQPISNLHWLTRILQNLLHIFGASGHYADVAAMLEMEMVLWPKQTHLQRDLALVLARIGQSQPASIWLDRYLKSNPDDPQKQDLEQLREVLKT